LAVAYHCPRERTGEYQLLHRFDIFQECARALKELCIYDLSSPENEHVLGDFCFFNLKRSRLEKLVFVAENPVHDLVFESLGRANPGTHGLPAPQLWSPFIRGLCDRRDLE